MCGVGALLRLRSRVTGAQEGRSLELELECDAAHLALMTQPLFEGMVAVASHWGGEASWVSWLDGRCSARTVCATQPPTHTSRWRDSMQSRRPPFVQ